MALSSLRWTRVSGQSPRTRRSSSMRFSIPFGERIALSRAQRSRDLAHLLIDVVVPRARGECIQLRFEISALLSFERRRTFLEPKGTVTGCAGRDVPDGIADCDKRGRRTGCAVHV